MLRRSDRRDRHTATNISKYSHIVWYLLRLVRVRNTEALRFKLTRFYCTLFFTRQKKIVLSKLAAFMQQFEIGPNYLFCKKQCGKKRKCWQAAFPHFPTAFSDGLPLVLFKQRTIWEGFKSSNKDTYFRILMPSMELRMQTKPLTLSKKTNYRLFQTQRVCRR